MSNSLVGREQGKQVGKIKNRRLSSAFTTCFHIHSLPSIVATVCSGFEWVTQGLTFSRTLRIGAQDETVLVKA